MLAAWPTSHCSLTSSPTILRFNEHAKKREDLQRQEILHAVFVCAVLYERTVYFAISCACIGRLNQVVVNHVREQLGGVGEECWYCAMVYRWVLSLLSIHPDVSVDDKRKETEIESRSLGLVPAVTIAVYRWASYE